MNKHERNIEGYLKQFTNQDHKQQVLEFKRLRETIDTNSKGEKISLSTISSDIHAILQLSLFLKKKPFNKACQDDMMEFDRWLRKKFGDNSSTMIEQKIKRFYKYVSDPTTYKKGKQMQKTIKYPECVQWMSTVRNSKELPIESILTEKQIKKLLNSCKDVREQTILVSLLDGGLRVSELISLKIKNVGFDKQLGAFFILPKKAEGLKTGSRKIQLFLIPSATLYIREYLNHHPFKDDADAPFIYSDANQVKNKPVNELFMQPEGIWWIVKRIGNDAGIKDIHPHLLRHVSATFCAMRGFNEAMMRERFGWSTSSTMPSYYTHLASKDTSDFIKKLLGIKDEEKPEESILQPIICWNCGNENPPTNKFCGKCSANLKPSEKEMVTATDIGISMQKAMPQDEIYQTLFKKLQDMEGEIKELKQKK